MPVQTPKITCTPNQWIWREEFVTRFLEIYTFFVHFNIYLKHYAFTKFAPSFTFFFFFFYIRTEWTKRPLTRRFSWHASHVAKWDHRVNNNNNNNIGFPGQIRKFENQIHVNFIQIRQILSCRENYHSNSFSFMSKESAFMSFNLKSALRAFKFATARQGV